MTKAEFTALLDRYVQGTCSPEEAALFGRFVDKMTATPPDWSLTDEERIRLDIWRGIRKDIPFEGGKRGVLRLPQWLRVAAVLAVIMTLVFFLWPRQDGQLVTVITGAGERDTVVLADGSTIYLNEGSRVVYPDRFTRNSRTVSLAGEAFFEVAKDKSRPFVVEAGGLRTIALGTAFNIRALDDSSDVKVSLVTGQVAVQALRGGAAGDTLTPGHQVRYRLADQQVLVEEFNASFTLGWRANKLSFDNEPLDVVLAKLARLYKIRIEFNKQLVHHCVVNGVFDNTETVQTILRVLTFSNNLAFSQQQDTYIVTGAGCD